MTDRDNSYGDYSGRFPAVVREYDAEQRLCRVEIPGITDGAETFPNAEIEYPIGDRTRGDLATEIEILSGDAVWVSFIGGDPRYPIITGWRLPRAGNEKGWRRWHHENVEILGESRIKIKAERIDLN